MRYSSAYRMAWSRLESSTTLAPDQGQYNKASAPAVGMAAVAEQPDVRHCWCYRMGWAIARAEMLEERAKCGLAQTRHRHSVLFLLRSSGRLRGCRENTGSSSPRERPPIHPHHPHHHPHHHHHHHHLQPLAPRTQLWGSLRRGRILRTRATILPSPILCLDRNQVCHDLARAMLPRCSEGSPETSVRELEQRTLSGVRGTKNGDGNAVRRIEKASVGRLFVANGERSEVDSADRRTAEWVTHRFRIRPHTADPVLCPSGRRA